MHQHPDDIFTGLGGRSTTPMKMVNDDETLRGTHNGGVCVHEGTFTLARGAVHNGSLRLEPGAHATIFGVHNGSLHLSSDSRVVIHGRHNGSVHVETGGHVRVEPSAGVAGSLHVGGTVENAGTRAGSVTVDGGELLDLPGSRVVEPQVRADGVHVYNF